MTSLEDTDYESSTFINETDFHQFHPHVHVRSGYSGYRDRTRYRPNNYGNVLTQRDRDQFDYVDDRNRETDGNFYDNKYVGHHYRMHG